MSDAEPPTADAEARSSPPANQAALHWLSIALGDLRAAELILEGDLPLRTAAGHAQQAAEKALKGALALDGRDPPRIHDLAALALAVGLDFRDSLEHIDLDGLTEGGAAGRYPGLDDEPYVLSEAEALVGDARMIIERVTAVIREHGVALVDDLPPR